MINLDITIHKALVVLIVQSDASTTNWKNKEA